MLAGTDDTATSDGFVVGNSLFVTYSTARGGIGFAQLELRQSSVSSPECLKFASYGS